MKNMLSYSTEYIDNEMKSIRLYLESDKQGINSNSGVKRMLYQRLDQCIAEQSYDWIINKLRDIYFLHVGDGDLQMWLEVDIKSAKESYYIAASIGALIYEMIERGFSHHVLDSGYPYDFKRNNFNFSLAAILANEYELATKVTGSDTVEGALVLQDYQLACTLLPESPEDGSMNADEICQCMWAVAHGSEELFNKYMEKRIRMLRRYARLNTTIFDRWGMAVIKLAQQRGIKCNLDVIELSYYLLDDIKIDTCGLSFSRTEQIRCIIDKSDC